MTKKQILLLPLFLALIMPYIPLAAQEDDEDGDYYDYADYEFDESDSVGASGNEAVQEKAKPQSTQSGAVSKPAQNTGKKSVPSLPSMKNAKRLFAQIIGYVSKIGGIFGKTTGIRIGGSTGTAIITLIIASLLRDNVPSWIRYLLYAGGGTMFAGGGANIVQLIMGYLSI